MKSIILGVLAFVLVSKSPAYAIDTGNCIANCSALVEIGDTFHVVARDQEGKIFRIKDTGFNPKDIVKDFGASNKVIDGNARAAKRKSSGGGSTNVTRYYYETASEFVLIVIVEFYDEEGRLIDVQVHEYATPKGGGPHPQD